MRGTVNWSDPCLDHSTVILHFHLKFLHFRSFSKEKSTTQKSLLNLPPNSQHWCVRMTKFGLWELSSFFRSRQDLACTSQVIIFQTGRISNCSILQGDCTWRRTFYLKNRHITKGDSHTHILRFAASPNARKQSKPKEKKKHEIFINLRHIHAPFSHAPSVLGECLASHLKALELHLSSLK